MKVLVTGAGGFSGSEIVRALVAKGHYVVAALGRTHVAPAFDAKARVIAGDLATMALPQEPFDAIVHAAARSPGPSVQLLDYIRDNVVSTWRVTEFARAVKAQKLIYLSSLSIYGEIRASTVDENTAITMPDSYGITKKYAEELVRAEDAPYASISIRLPGVLGKGSVRNWLTNVLAAAKTGTEISVFNPAASFNNAVHVSDLSRFICHLVDLPWSGHDAVTIAAEGEITVLAAVKAITDRFSSRSTIRLKESPRKSFTVSIERAKQRYGYTAMEIGRLIDRFCTENQ